MRRVLEGGRGELQLARSAVLEEVAPDFYGMLGVPRYTTEAGIRKAYLRKARRSHPDLHPDDPDASERMAALNIAYDTLSDPTRRARYDIQRVQVKLRLPTEPYTRVCTSGYSTGHELAIHYHGQKDPGFLDIATDLIRRIVRSITA